MTMEQPPKAAILNSVADIMQAFANGSLATKPLLVLTSAVQLLEDVRFAMIQAEQKIYQPTEADRPVSITTLRYVGDHINALRNGLIAADRAKYATVDEREVSETTATRMAVSVETTGGNLHPQVAELIEELTASHTHGLLKARFAGLDVLDSPVWQMELTAPSLSLTPFFTPRRVMLSAMTARRSGANCVVTATITLMVP